ncbi:MAG: hypothetical protein M0P43_09805 [Arcobacteraceae bacterium]|jgi:hypothetical protein|nr:hypothetical protein [Arcobacteraceae bacterium]
MELILFGTISVLGFVAIAISFAYFDERNKQRGKLRFDNTWLNVTISHRKVHLHNE